MKKYIIKDRNGDPVQGSLPYSNPNTDADNIHDVLDEMLGTPSQGGIPVDISGLHATPYPDQFCAASDFFGEPANYQSAAVGQLVNMFNTARMCKHIAESRVAIGKASGGSTQQSSNLNARYGIGVEELAALTNSKTDTADKLVPVTPAVLNNVDLSNHYVWSGGTNLKSTWDSPDCMARMTLIGIADFGSTLDEKIYPKTRDILFRVNDEVILDADLALPPYIDRTLFPNSGNKAYIVSGCGGGQLFNTTAVVNGVTKRVVRATAAVVIGPKLQAIQDSDGNYISTDRAKRATISFLASGDSTHEKMWTATSGTNAYQNAGFSTHANRQTNNYFRCLIYRDYYIDDALDDSNTSITDITSEIKICKFTYILGRQETVNNKPVLAYYNETDETAGITNNTLEGNKCYFSHYNIYQYATKQGYVTYNASTGQYKYVSKLPYTGDNGYTNILTAKYNWFNFTSTYGSYTYNGETYYIVCAGIGTATANGLLLRTKDFITFENFVYPAYQTNADSNGVMNPQVKFEVAVKVFKISGDNYFIVLASRTANNTLRLTAYSFNPSTFVKTYSEGNTSFNYINNFTSGSDTELSDSGSRPELFFNVNDTRVYVLHAIAGRYITEVLDNNYDEETLGEMQEFLMGIDSTDNGGLHGLYGVTAITRVATTYSMNYPCVEKNVTGSGSNRVLHYYVAAFSNKAESPNRGYIAKFGNFNYTTDNAVPVMNKFLDTFGVND